jgi:hypothetical protein
VVGVALEHCAVRVPCREHYLSGLQTGLTPIMLRSA